MQPILSKEEILQKINLKAYFSQYCDGIVDSGDGQYSRCFCPFHDEKNASFVFNHREKGRWKCLADCVESQGEDGKSHGDLFTFHMRINNCDFPTAIADISRFILEFEQANNVAPGDNPDANAGENDDADDDDWDDDDWGDAETNQDDDEGADEETAEQKHDEVDSTIQTAPPPPLVTASATTTKTTQTAPAHESFDDYKKRCAGKRIDVVTATRGIGTEACNFFGLSCYENKKDQTWWVNIPVVVNGFVQSVKRHRIKGYSNSPKSKNSKGGKKALFNGDTLDLQSVKRVFICEGELDLMRLAHEASWFPKQGVQLDTTIVSSTAGASTWSQDWNKKFLGKEAVIILDCDNAGKSGAKKIVSSLQSAGVTAIKNVVLPLKGTKQEKDLTDFFKLGHTMAELEKLIQDTPYEKVKRTFMIELGVAQGDIMRASKECVEALRQHFPDTLYNYGGNLTQISLASGRPKLKQVGVDELLTLVNESATLHTISKDGLTIEEKPPKEVLTTILSMLPDSFPRILSVVEHPTILLDGTVIDKNGYIPEHQIFCYIPEHLKMPPIPAKVKKSKIIKAKQLLEEVVVDFPYEKPCHRSAFFAALFTGICLPVIDGPTPLFLFIAPAAGSGKTLAVDLIHNVMTGVDAARTQYTENNEENRKMITTLAKEGKQFVLYDNIEVVIGGGAIEAAITSSIWADRLLGGSTQFEGPLRMLWTGTANNPNVKGDMHRRILICRVNAGVEKPETRTCFKHPRLLAWIKSRRADILHAVLVLMKAFLTSKKRRKIVQGLSPFGGFEAWNELIRACLSFHGYDDPLKAREEFLEQANTQDAQVACVLACWFVRYGSIPVKLREIWNNDIVLEPATADPNAPPKNAEEWKANNDLRSALTELAPDKSGRLFDVKHTGNILRRYVDRPLSGYVLRKQGGDPHNGIKWSVERLP